MAVTPTSDGTNLSIDRALPTADYTALDFLSIRQLLINYLVSPSVQTRITDVSDDQLIVVIIELIAFFGDVLTYNLNSLVRELFVATAQRMPNLLNAAKPFAYQVSSPAAATVTLTATLDPSANYPFSVNLTDQFSNGSQSDEVFFQPTTAFDVASYPGGGTITIDCQEGELFQLALLKVSDGTPSQTIQFTQDNVIVSTVLVYVAGVLWQPITSWAFATSSDQVYRLSYTDSGTVFATFGDGNYGAIPVNGGQIRATFACGGGTRGNLGPNTITTIVGADPAILAVTNAPISPSYDGYSSGGTDFQTIGDARNAIPASLSSLKRGVTANDYAALALQVAGVAKAFASQGFPPGSRQIVLTVAPEGGGAPTNTLKNSILAALAAAKMLTNLISVDDGFVYKQLVVSMLVYVNNSYNPSTVAGLVRTFFDATDGSGLFDFDQLAPAALDANGQLLLSDTRLQGIISIQLNTIGVNRIVFEQLSILPIPSTGPTNLGNGTFPTASIVVTTQARRREYVVVLTSSTTFSVFERIIGYVSSLTDLVLTDDTKIFENEGVTSYLSPVPYLLIPNRLYPSNVFPVVAVAAQSISIATGESLFSLTQIGNEYCLYSPIPYTGTVGVQFTIPNGTVSFMLVQGGTSFTAGDNFSLDVYPLVGDLQLRTNEYPQLNSLAIRTSGGAKV